MNALLYSVTAENQEQVSHTTPKFILQCICDCVVLEFLTQYIIHFLIIIDKSTSLKNALSLFGAHVNNIHGPDTPLAAIVSQASMTTVPLGKQCPNCHYTVDPRLSESTKSVVNMITCL